VHALPTISTSNPAPRCGEGAVTLTASASGTTTANTYTWKVGDAAETTTPTGSLSLASVALGSTTYSVTVTNAAGCTSAAATGTITVHGLPTISHVTGSGSPTQMVGKGSEISAIKFYATNASSITVSGTLPGGLSASYSANTYTISGTPTSQRTYTVTTTNSNGCANATASGTIIQTGCTPPTIELGTVDFTSSTTYELNGLIISSPVTATYCNARTYTDFVGPENATCAPHATTPAYGNWFSWCMVAHYAEQLCPDPWRVPTRSDHCQLLSGDPSNCTKTGSLSSYGYVKAGYVVNGTATKINGEGWYWAMDELRNNTTTLTEISNSAQVSNTGREFGFPLRCVRDAQ
jgi:hypothetical protein